MVTPPSRPAGTAQLRRSTLERIRAHTPRSVAIGWGWLAFVLLLIYAFDCGKGFIKDDFSWIESSRCGSFRACAALFLGAPMGFYRPLVSLSFAANYALSGLTSLPYGLTNLALLFAIAFAVARLARAAGLSAGAALFAAAIWALNFHGVGMAVLWISGRTSLLATLCAVLSAERALAGRPVVAAVVFFAGLLAKEEPLLLPLILLGWRAAERQRSDGWYRDASAWTTAAAAVLYVAGRTLTGAWTPSTAPSFYVPALSAVPINAVHYLDRTFTFPLALLLIGAAFVPRSERGMRQVAPHHRAAVVKGLIWVVLSFALTLALPIRSSLYVCLPLVGSALAAAAIAEAFWPVTRQRRRLLITAALLPLLLVPVYRERNRQIRDETLLSANALAIVTAEAALGTRRFVLAGRPGAKPSIADAFGDALPVVARLWGRDGELELREGTDPDPRAALLRQSAADATAWILERPSGASAR